MTDAVPGLTVYTITMKEAREIPGPQQHIDHLRESFWAPPARCFLPAPNPLAGLVRRHRTELGLSQHQLSRMIGAAPNYVGTLESGAFIRPFEYVLPLAEVLNIPATSLLEAGSMAIAQQKEARNAQAA